VAFSAQRIRVEWHECYTTRTMAVTEVDTHTSLEMVDARQSRLYSYGLSVWTEIPGTAE
jgi:hypothetical protein